MPLNNTLVNAWISQRTSRLRKRSKPKIHGDDYQHAFLSVQINNGETSGHGRRGMEVMEVVVSARVSHPFPLPIQTATRRRQSPDAVQVSKSLLAITVAYIIDIAAFST